MNETIRVQMSGRVLKSHKVIIEGEEVTVIDSFELNSMTVQPLINDDDTNYQVIDWLGLTLKKH